MALRTVYERDDVLLGVLRRFCPSEHAAQVPAVRSDDSGLPRLQFIDRVGHCSYAAVTGFPSRANCAEHRCDSFVQFFGKVVEFLLLCNDKCQV